MENNANIGIEQELEERKRKLEELKDEKQRLKFEKKARKTTHLRHFKNFMFVFLGIFLGLALIAGGICIGLFAIPVKDYLKVARVNSVKMDLGEGSKVYPIEDVIDQNILTSNVFTVIKNGQTYTVGQLPIVKGLLDGIIDGTNMITFDVGNAELDSLKITDVSKLADFIMINPTALGSLKDLGIFQYGEVKDENRPETAIDDYKPDLYYYKKADSYLPAFVNGSYATGVDNSTQLYYVSLADVSISQAMKLMGDRIAQVPVVDVVSVFGGSIGKIGDIIGDATIAELKNFDYKTITLSKILSYETSPSVEKLYNALAKMFDKSKDQITVGDLDGFDFNNIVLTDVVSVSGNEKFYEVLEDIVGKESSAITIKDISSGMDFEKIKLTSVLPKTEQNEKLYEVLMSSTGKALDEITVADLKSFSTQAVKLKDVIDPTANKNIFDILCNATGKTQDVITVGDLSSFSVTSIKLVDVISEGDNAKLYSILTGALNKQANKIIVGDLAGFNTSGVKFKDIVDVASNTNLYNILCNACSTDMVVKTPETLTVGDLDNLDTNRILLKNVLPKEDNADIYEILTDATGKSEDALSIGNIAESFEIDNIRFKILLDEGENPDVYEILKDATGKAANKITIGDIKAFDVNDIKIKSIIDEPSATTPAGRILKNFYNSDVTVGNLQTEINALTVEEIFDVECWTKNSSETAETSVVYSYDENTNTYSLTTGTPTELNNLYYISKKASIWLVMLYDADGISTVTGLADSYTHKEIVFNDLDESVENASVDIMEYSLRQLYLCGLLNNKPKVSIQGKTITEIIAIVESIP